MFSLWLYFVLSSSSLSFTIAENVYSTRIGTTCSGLIKSLTHKFYCDNYLISELTTERLDLSSLLKYTTFKTDNINTELLSVCPDFSGRIKEQGLHCPKYEPHRSCREAMTNGSGIYRLELNGMLPFFAYCLEDPKGGDPWTIIQRRVDSGIPFNRNYAEYKTGFGDLLRSYWIGLEKISKFTAEHPWELWIELLDYDDQKHETMYDSFAIGDSDMKYALVNIGESTGTGGDSLSRHLGYPFSTVDECNDADCSCAKNTKAGWWFEACGLSNLNGEFYDRKEPEPGRGIYWYTWKGNRYSYKYAHMAIREKYSLYCY